MLSYLWNQIENGIGCPTGMAYAACAGFAGRPEFALWREKTLSGEYDPRRLPLPQKTGAVIGYAMTEKQGGSDLRQTQTTAVFSGTEDGAQIYQRHRSQVVLLGADLRRLLHAGADRNRA